MATKNKKPHINDLLPEDVAKQYKVIGLDSFGPRLQLRWKLYRVDDKVIAVPSGGTRPKEGTFIVHHQREVNFKTISLAGMQLLENMNCPYIAKKPAPKAPKQTTTSK